MSNPSLVQVVNGSDSVTTDTSVSVSLANTTGANCLLVIVHTTNNVSITSITDGGDTFVVASAPVLLDATNSQYLQTAYAVNIAGFTTPTVTVNFSGAHGHSDIMVWEITGTVKSGNPINATSTASGSSTAPTTNITPAAGEMIVVYCETTTAVTFTIGAGFTNIVSGSFGAGEIQANASNTSTASGFTISPTSPWDLVALTIKVGAPYDPSAGGVWDFAGTEYNFNCTPIVRDEEYETSVPLGETWDVYDLDNFNFPDFRYLQITKNTEIDESIWYPTNFVVTWNPSHGGSWDWLAGFDQKDLSSWFKDHNDDVIAYGGAWEIFDIPWENASPRYDTNQIFKNAELDESVWYPPNFVLYWNPYLGGTWDWVDNFDQYFKGLSFHFDDEDDHTVYLPSLLQPISLFTATFEPQAESQIWVGIQFSKDDPIDPFTSAVLFVGKLTAFDFAEVDHEKGFGYQIPEHLADEFIELIQTAKGTIRNWDEEQNQITQPTPTSFANFLEENRIYFVIPPFNPATQVGWDNDADAQLVVQFNSITKDMDYWHEYPSFPTIPIVVVPICNGYVVPPATVNEINSLSTITLLDMCVNAGINHWWDFCTRRYACQVLFARASTPLGSPPFLLLQMQLTFLIQLKIQEEPEFKFFLQEAGLI